MGIEDTSNKKVVVFIFATCVTLSITIAVSLFLLNDQKKRKKKQSDTQNVNSEIIENEEFKLAIEASKTLLDLSSEEKLLLYSLYKTAVVGAPNEGDQPSSLDIVNKLKFEAWVTAANRLKNDSESAMSEYVSTIQLLVGKYNKKGETNVGGGDDEDGGKEKKKQAAKGMRVVSVMAKIEEDDHLLPESNSSAFFKKAKDFIQTNNETGFLELINNTNSNNNEDVNEVDEEGRSLLHWSVDGDKIWAIQALLSKRGDVININIQDIDGLTPLMYAGLGDLIQLVEILLNNGADDSLRSFDNNESFYEMATDRCRLLARKKKQS